MRADQVSGKKSDTGTAESIQMIFRIKEPVQIVFPSNKRQKQQNPLI